MQPHEQHDAATSARTLMIAFSGFQERRRIQLVGQRLLRHHFAYACLRGAVAYQLLPPPIIFAGMQKCQRRHAIPAIFGEHDQHCPGLVDKALKQTAANAAQRMD